MAQAGSECRQSKSMLLPTIKPLFNVGTQTTKYIGEFRFLVLQQWVVHYSRKSTQFKSFASQKCVLDSLSIPLFCMFNTKSGHRCPGSTLVRWWHVRDKTLKTKNGWHMHCAHCRWQPCKVCQHAQDLGQNPEPESLWDLTHLHLVLTSDTQLVLFLDLRKL